MAYKFGYHLDIKKLVTDLKGPKGVSALKEEFAKIKKELTHLKDVVKPQAEAKYNQLLKRLQTAQIELDTEVSKTLLNLKKQAQEVEKNLEKYRKMALAQKKRLQAKLKGQQGKSTTRKKTTRKTTKKTTRKAAKTA